MMPKRIQRRRARGWRMPDGAVYVGRPTAYGNPFRPGDPHPHYDNGRLIEPGEAVTLYAGLLLPYIGRDDYPLWAAIQKLRGKDLACWCPLDRPCHADVLLKVANR